jgi:MFS family permease
MTVNGVVRAFTDNVFGKISDRLGRKPFFLVSTFVGGFVIFFHSIAAEKPMLLRAWGWTSIGLDIFSGLFGVALAGYLKDCIPHQLFNQVDAGSNMQGERRWTAITQAKVVTMGGMVVFVFGAICMLAVLKVFGGTEGLKLNMAIGGVICWIAGIYCLFMVPETVDPTYSRANSLRSYLGSANWIEDANPFRNFQQVYRSQLDGGNESRSSRCVKVYLLWSLLVSMQAENASVTVQYVMYRYGMNSFWIGIILIIGVAVSLVVLLFAEPLIRMFGELFHSKHNQIMIGFLGSLAWCLNPCGGFWLAWSAIVGTSAVGALVITTMPQRLVDYHAQATMAASLHSLKSLAQACVRLPITALFSYGIKHTNLTDYTLHTDCTDEARLRAHCAGNAQFGVLGGGNSANGTFCDIVDDEGCWCSWESIECPAMPPLFEAQGGAFDVLASVYMGTGLLGVAATLVWMYFACALDPLGEMETRRVTEIAKWKGALRGSGEKEGLGEKEVEQEEGEGGGKQMPLALALHEDGEAVAPEEGAAAAGKEATV